MVHFRRYNVENLTETSAVVSEYLWISQRRSIPCGDVNEKDSIRARLRSCSGDAR